ncbi:MAG: hypothetical protein QM770_08410 [Tepidisphaeraceae bacterium]
MGPHDLLNKLQDEPFKPFRIKLSNNTVIDVKNPGMVIVGSTSAVLPTDTFRDEAGYTLVRQWKTISIGHIVEMIDLDLKDEPKRKRGR